MKLDKGLLSGGSTLLLLTLLEREDRYGEGMMEDLTLPLVL